MTARRFSLPTADAGRLPSSGSQTSDLDGRSWLAKLRPYSQPSAGRSLVELAISLVPLFALWAAMAVLAEISYLLCLLLAIPAAGFLLRVFMIQHDCGHGSFFRKRAANDWLGRALGVLTLTPYDYWRGKHAIHHATSGNLDRRGTGDVDTLTVTEFQSLTRGRQMLYRLSRNPLVVLGLAPLYLFVLRYRLPSALSDPWSAWLSTMLTNLGIVALVVVLAALVGIGTVLLVQLPITLLAATAGVWLFYVQHQFEDTFWERNEAWSFHQGALASSSHFDLPPLLRWFTANIGVHHVHHLCSRIPSYRLGRVVRDFPELRGINRLTLRHSFECFRLALWDEEKKALVSFRDAAAARA